MFTVPYHHNLESYFTSPLPSFTGGCGLRDQPTSLSLPLRLPFPGRFGQRLPYLHASQTLNIFGDEPPWLPSLNTSFLHIIPVLVSHCFS